MSERYTPPGPRPWWEDIAQVAFHVGPIWMAAMAGWAGAHEMWGNVVLAGFIPVFYAIFLIYFIISERRHARKRVTEWAKAQAEEDARP